MCPVYLVGSENTPSAADGTSVTPPELDGPTPRTVRMTSTGVTTLAYVAFLFALTLAGVIWFGLQATNELENRAALRRGSVETTGEITRLYYAGKNTKQWVQYTFPVDGTFYTGKAMVPDMLSSAFQQHHFLEIRYLPGNPAVNHPSAWEETTSSSFTPFILPAVPLIVAIFLLTGFPAQRQLLSEGTPASAAITECSRGRNCFQLKYEFHTGDGVAANGSSVSDTPMKPGVQVRILYLPQNPRRNQTYPLIYYTVAKVSPNA
jgi:hypothetical protein